MKIVPYRVLDASAWDDVADHSGDAWTFHRWDWLAIEERFAAKANCSFAIEERGRLIAIHPLYRRDIDRGWTEHVLDSGYHRHTGLALRDGLPPEVAQGAAKLAMRHVLAEAEDGDVDRVLLNRQNLAPNILTQRTAEIPLWIQEFGFEQGMRLTSAGDRAVPGLSNVFADQILCLEPALDDLLRKTDKAAVRMAERSGLTFAVGSGGAIAEYHELAKLAAVHTGERLVDASYYQTIWDRLSTTNRAAILFARHEGKPAAANLYLLDKGAVSYLAGVSHPDYLACWVNDFLHWQAIAWAKSQGQRYYRFGPVFPDVPADWPIAKVSCFKSKFGSQSYTVIQGNYFRKPERYQAESLRAAQAAGAMRLEEVQQRRRDEATRNVDSARDLAMVLRRYGFMGIDVRARANDLVDLCGLWWQGCPVALADCADRVQAIIEPRDEDLATLGIKARLETAPAFLYEKRVRPWWFKTDRTYQALLPHLSFSGPNIEAIWHNARGRAVLAWWHYQGRKILLVGLAVAEELVRYTQGDRDRTFGLYDRARHNMPFERAHYLFEGHLTPGAAGIPWADRLGYKLVRLLARQTGLPLVEPLPGGAKGLVLLTGDDDQAALSAYDEQLALLGDFPITYFLLPFTKHTRDTLAAMPGSVDFGVHVDALEHPDQYETICAEQTAAVRSLCGRPIRTIRNHGYLNRGYLGHLRAWEECGLTLDVNYAGLDGTALTGSFLPFRNRRPDGNWSSHVGLLTAFGDGMLSVGKCTEAKAIRRVYTLAAQIEKSDPGILVFNMHPENIQSTRQMHQAIMALGRRPGWLALTVPSYLQWLESWQALHVRRDGAGLWVDAPQPIENLALRMPADGAWQHVTSARVSGLQHLSQHFRKAQNHSSASGAA